MWVDAQWKLGFICVDPDVQLATQFLVNHGVGKLLQLFRVVQHILDHISRKLRPKLLSLRVLHGNQINLAHRSQTHRILSPLNYLICVVCVQHSNIFQLNSGAVRRALMTSPTRKPLRAWICFLRVHPSTVKLRHSTIMDLTHQFPRATSVIVIAYIHSVRFRSFQNLNFNRFWTISPSWRIATHLRNALTHGAIRCLACWFDGSTR